MLPCTDRTESAEILYLRSRICGLEHCVCELLTKNEMLRLALSADASLKWLSRNDALEAREHVQS